MPIRTWTFLMTAFLHLYFPVVPRISPPPCTMLPIFVDAACYYNKSFLVSSYRTLDYATTVETPPWICNIQDAELYAIFHGLRQSCLRKISVCWLPCSVSNRHIWTCAFIFTDCAYQITSSCILHLFLHLSTMRITPHVIRCSRIGPQHLVLTSLCIQNLFMLLLFLHCGIEPSSCLNSG